jgi:formylmethanofuran:tetrahydromethanopterin formyltransferase
MAESANVIAFAIIMGQFIKINPYTNHKTTPKVNILYIGSEMPDKSRVLYDLYACGTKANVVSAAARLPTKLAVCKIIIELTLN